MNGYLKDGEGNKSSKRLIAMITGVNANLIATASVVIATIKVADGVLDVGQNIVYLVGGMLAVATGVGAATAFANRNGGKS